MVRNIVQIGDPVLTKPAKSVKNVQDKKVQKVIQDLLDTCRAGNDHTAGLAGPQIGEGLRIAVVRNLDIEEEMWEVLVNPKLISKDKDNQSLLWEACLSIGKGERMLWGPVYRPDNVVVEYTKQDGVTATINASGYYSHLIQHEIDHLDGILFISHVERPEQNLWLGKDLDKYLEETGNYPEIV